jgi:hypothetical protein
MKVRGIPKRGRSGPVVFYQRGGKQYVRRHVPAKDLKTTAQRRVRDILKAVAKGYGHWLTEPEREAWDAGAEQLQSRPRLGQSGPLTGEMLFVKLTTPRALIGRSWLRLPTAPVVFGPSPVGELTLRREQGRLRLELAISGPVTGDIMVLATPPCRPTWRNCRKARYFGLLPAPVDGVSDITALYLERFGEPEPGQRIFVRTSSSGMAGKASPWTRVTWSPPRSYPRSVALRLHHSSFLLQPSPFRRPKGSGGALRTLFFTLLRETVRNCAPFRATGIARGICPVEGATTALASARFRRKFQAYERTDSQAQNAALAWLVPEMSALRPGGALPALDAAP